MLVKFTHVYPMGGRDAMEKDNTSWSEILELDSILHSSSEWKEG